MQQTSPFDFGLLVAYLVPGFVALWGVGHFSPTVQAWLTIAPSSAPAVGDLFFATLGSLAAGMIASAFRWGIIDTLHHRTGIPPPAWDFSHLPERLAAYEALIDMHYRYYQFYANMLVAMVFTFVTGHASLRGSATPVGVIDAGFLVVAITLFLGSRDALRKYYRRGSDLLGVKGEPRPNGDPEVAGRGAEPVVGRRSGDRKLTQGIAGR